MKALIDADVLTYECAYGCLTGWEGDGPPPFDRAAELLDNKINNILAITEASDYQLYLTGKNNFREKIAVSKPYKGNRLQEKPFHYKNLRAYMVGKWNAIIIDGMEADDAMAIEQCNSWYYSREVDGEGNQEVYPQSIICTRDKDLRQVPGLHYGWELGNQPSFGPKYISEEEGMRFFYKQCLTGDRVDNIPGLKGYGPKKTFSVLNGIVNESDMYSAVLTEYKKQLGDTAEEYLLEQGRLLHMTRRFENNRVLLWNPPDIDYEDWMDVDTGAIERHSLV